MNHEKGKVPSSEGERGPPQGARGEDAGRVPQFALERLQSILVMKIDISLSWL